MERVNDILNQIGQGEDEGAGIDVGAVVSDSTFSWVWAIGLAVIAYLAYRYFSKSKPVAKEE